MKSYSTSISSICGSCATYGGSEHTASRGQFVYLTHSSAGYHTDVIQVEHSRCQELWTYCSPGSLPPSAINSQKNSVNAESWLDKNVRNPRQRDSPQFVINLCLFFQGVPREINSIHVCLLAECSGLAQRKDISCQHYFFWTRTSLKQVAGSRDCNLSFGGKNRNNHLRASVRENAVLLIELEII